MPAIAAAVPTSLVVVAAEPVALDLQANHPDGSVLVVRSLGATPDGVLFGGHTDAKGSDACNSRPPGRRAGVVAGWLAGQEGVEPARLEGRGFEEARKVAPDARPDGGGDPEGRRSNRRVEVILLTTPR